MKLTWASVENYTLQFEVEPGRNDFVLNPIVVLQPTEVTRSGAKKIIKDFDYTDFGTPLTLGAIQLGSLIVNTVLEITTTFDTGAITIGTQSAQGLLMTTGEVDLKQGKYQRNNYLELYSSEIFKAFFTGSPTVGSGRITTFYIE